LRERALAALERHGITTDSLLHRIAATFTAF
jgi:hypothetical protein